jgi:hypothetical protein
VWDSYAKDIVMQMKSDFLFHDVREFHDWLKEQFDSSS